jgi:hypothetical protein
MKLNERLLSDCVIDRASDCSGPFSSSTTSYSRPIVLKNSVAPTPGAFRGVIDPLADRRSRLLRDSERSIFGFGSASGEQSSFSTESATNGRSPLRKIRLKEAVFIGLPQELMLTLRPQKEFPADDLVTVLPLRQRGAHGLL